MWSATSRELLAKSRCLSFSNARSMPFGRSSASFGLIDWSAKRTILSPSETSKATFSLFLSNSSRFDSRAAVRNTSSNGPAPSTVPTTCSSSGRPATRSGEPRSISCTTISVETTSRTWSSLSASTA